VLVGIPALAIEIARQTISDGLPNVVVDHGATLLPLTQPANDWGVETSNQ
jgi:hypothetical protein